MDTHQICHKINDEILQRVDRVGVGLLHITARPHKSNNYKDMLANDRTDKQLLTLWLHDTSHALHWTFLIHRVPITRVLLALRMM
jgi:hypothetical protein